MPSELRFSRLRSLLSWLLLAGIVALPGAVVSQDETVPDGTASDETALGETVPPEPLAAWQAALARGDAAWEGRAEGHRGGRAAAGPIGEAVKAYEEALREAPKDFEIRWKLLRALYFQGDFVVTDVEKKKEIFGRGREVVEGALDLLAPEVGGREKLDGMTPKEIAAAFAGRDEVGYVYYWGAIAWGLWGDAYGKMAAARQGVGRKIDDYARVAIELVPDHESAGGHRLLGRLHTEAPKIPFFTGWIDRDLAISELRIAHEKAPEEPYNPVYLADALLRFDKKKEQEAIRLLEEAVTRTPRDFKLVEDTKILGDAKALLRTAKN